MSKETVTNQAWVKWPFQWLSDLQLGEEKVTLNHLVHIFVWTLGGIKVPSSFIGVLRSPNSYVESQHHTAAEQEKRTTDLETKSLTSPIESKVCGCVCFLFTIGW